MGKIKYLGAVLVKQKIKKPTRAKVYCFSNQKGGVGKSTSAQVMCEALALHGYKVLAIDLDVQANFSISADAQETKHNATLRKAFDDIAAGNEVTKEKCLDLIVQTNGGYDIMCAGLDMITVDRDFATCQDADLLLRKLVEPIRDQYHYIVIDTQPNLYMLTRNAFCLADEIIIPMQPNGSSTDGLGLLLFLFDQIKSTYNPDLSVNGIFFTMVEDGANPRETILGMHEAAEAYNLRVMRSFIKKAKIYDNLRDKHVSLSPQLLKNPQMAQYLLLINEIFGKVLFKLSMEET